MTETGDIRISVGAEAPSTAGTKLDPIQLSIFSHRFMSIAGEWPLLSSLQAWLLLVWDMVSLYTTQGQAQTDSIGSYHM